MLLEHLFVGEMLRHLWSTGRHAELLHPKTDDAGYDIAVECQGILRHIQLKSSHSEGKAAHQAIQVALGRKPSGCVIWLFFDESTLQFTEYLWFGGSPGRPLPDLGDRVARHTKANAEGFKAFRPNLRLVPRMRFTPVDDIEQVTNKLFGPAPDLR